MQTPSFLVSRGPAAYGGGVAPAGQAVASMPYGQERFGGQSVAPAGQASGSLTPDEATVLRQRLGAPGLRCAPSAAAFQLLQSFSSAAFLQAVGSSCAQWATLAMPFKLQVLVGYFNGRGAGLQSNCYDVNSSVAAAGTQQALLFQASRTVDQYCAIQRQQQNVGAVAPRGGFPGATLLPRLYPAGQASALPLGHSSPVSGAAWVGNDQNGNSAEYYSDYTFIPGTVRDLSGNTIADTSIGAIQSYAAIPGAGTGTVATGSTAAVATMSPAAQQALYSAVSTGLNTTGATIAGIVNSGNQLQIASLASQTQTQIAQLQAAAQQAQAAGNLQLAQQNSAQAAQMQQFYQLLALKQQPTMMLVYAGAAVVGFVLLGTIVYFATRPPPVAPRSNPSDGSYFGNLRGHADHHLRSFRNPMNRMHDDAIHVGALRSSTSHTRSRR